MDSFWNGKRVLVTGANGFLGSHLCFGLIKNGAKVCGIDKDAGERKAGGFKAVKCDIVDFKSVEKAFSLFKPDICLHVAAQPIVGIANKSPLSTFKVNIEGTWNILEVAKNRILKALVVASSEQVYGEHKKLPYEEDAALLALRPYDASKSCTDILARAYAHTYGLNTAVTRCANIYGPGDFNFSRIIPDTMQSVIANKRPVIRSDGTPLRDYLYINDAVEAYLVLAKSLYLGKIKAGEAFNFGSGKPVSVLSLVKAILRIAKKPNLKPEILGRNKFSGEIRKQYLSSLKARKILGWKCQYSLEQGLKDSFEWYCKNL